MDSDDDESGKDYHRAPAEVEEKPLKKATKCPTETKPPVSDSSEKARVVLTQSEEKAAEPGGGGGADTFEDIMRDFEEEARTFETYPRLEEYLGTLPPADADELRRNPRVRYLKEVFESQKVGVENLFAPKLEKGWEVKVDNQDGISVYYRKEKDSALHSLKVQVIIAREMLPIITVLNEIDLLPEIVKDVITLETRLLACPVEYHKLVYAKVDLWWPFYHRDLCAEVRATDALYTDHRCIFFHCTGFDTGQRWECQYRDAPGVDVPPEPKRTARMLIHSCYGAVRPIDPTHCQLSCVANIDFRTYMPNTIINWLARTVAHKGAKMVRARIESLEMSESHQQRMREKEIYRKWEVKLRDWYSWDEERRRREPRNENATEI